MTPARERATLNAVIAYAEQLRNRATKAQAADPYAKPYYPTTAAARKVYFDALAAIRRGDTHPDEEFLEADEQEHLAAERALQTLAGRALMRALDADQEKREADRSAKRHARRRRQAELDREAERAGLSCGQRIDRALAAFCMIAAPPAANLAPATGDGDPRVMPSDHGDPAGEAAYVARQAMRKVEELLDRARSRDVSKAA